MINFPTTLDTLSNPSAGDLLENATTVLDHDQQHSNANDAIEALEAKVGANSSAVTTSHDYKLGEVTGTDKAVGKTATQTLTNKTLTSPAINLGSNATGDIYYRDSGGTFQRLPIGTSTQILQVSSGGIPEWTTNPTGTNYLTQMPKPTYPSFSVGTLTWNSNTTGYVSQFILPVGITVNKISFNLDSSPVDGTIKIGIYSENGQTQKFAITTATLSAVGLYTTAVSSVALTAGVYYVVIVPVSTTSVTALGYQLGTGADVLNPVTSEPKMYGTLTVTAGTLPTTFTPSSITDSTNGLMPYLRLDN